jgi:hypothetical protein
VVTDSPARAGRNHFVVCGDDPLALRLVEELTVRYGEQVTVILPSARRGHGPIMARLPGGRPVSSSEKTTVGITAR